MGIESIGSQFQASFGAGVQHAEAAKGSFMGRAVTQAATPESLLASAAEELAFSVDTTDDFELEERKERDKSIKSQEERVKMYQEMMHQAGKGHKIDSLRESLRAGGDVRAMLDKAREHFPDPSDAWAALREIAEELKADGAAPSLVREVEEAARRLEEAEGPAIRAGVQGALASRDFPQLGEADAMRDLYRQTVCEFSSVMEVFRHVQTQYGGDFEASMDFLFSALSADIASDVPSMGSRHLESVHGTLGKVRLAQSAYRLCGDVMDRWATVHGVKTRPGGLDAMKLLGDVLALGEMRFLSGMQVDTIVAKAGAPDIEREVLFVQELMNASRKFPSALFGDDQGRMKVLDAIQESIDGAVAREDEWLAQQEG